MKGMNDSLEAETVSEKGIEENSSVSNRGPVRKTGAFTETENPVGGQGWRGGRRRQRTPLWIHLVGGREKVGASWKMASAVRVVSLELGDPH